MNFSQLLAAEGIGVDVAAAAGEEEGDRTGIACFEFVLRGAGPAAVELHDIGPDGGVVTGVTEDDASYLAAGTGDAQHGDVVIHGAFPVMEGAAIACRSFDTAIDGEARPRAAEVQIRRREIRDGLADHLDNLVFEDPRVVVDGVPVPLAHVQIPGGEHTADDRSRMRVGGVEQECVTGELIVVSGATRDALRQVG